MAKSNRSNKRPQAKHQSSRSKSQFDKRNRLLLANPQRRKTSGARFPLVGILANHVTALAVMLDRRNAFRLSIIVAGMMLADDRRTAAAWFASAGVQDDWDCFYDCLISVGRKSRSIALIVLQIVLKKFVLAPGEHLTLGIDDSPTSRFGRHVEGAGVHYNPTPGPAQNQWLYGHNWVTLALLVRHKAWGVIALPLLSKLYVRLQDVAALDAKYGWKFRTKHELGVELVKWFVSHARLLVGECISIRLVADGAYAARNVLIPLLEKDVVGFSRLRSDAVLHDLPPQPKDGQRGRPRIYGKNRISLAKRAGQRRGWENVTYRGRGGAVTASCKTFLATSRLVSGVIRVVLVRFEGGGWAAYFSTNSELSASEILETISARWAIEEFFHDTKEVWGAAQQQVRNVYSNIGCWHLNLWMYTLVELCCWEAAESELIDRSDHPWDNPDRRPSHADKRRSISRKMLRKQFMKTLLPRPENGKIQALIEHVIRLAA